MAIALVCMGCGEDLAGVRSPPDPYYGLPLAICPRCGRATSRRLRAIRGRSRAIRRAACSISALAGQLVVAAVLTIATGDSIFDLQQHLAALHRIVGIEKTLVVVMSSWAFATAIITGTWLTACLSFDGYVRAFARWTTWLWLALVGLPMLIGLIEWPGPTGGEAPVRRTLVILAFMVVSLVGVPLGLIIERKFLKRGVTRWRSARRRLRAARTSR